MARGDGLVPASRAAFVIGRPATSSSYLVGKALGSRHLSGSCSFTAHHTRFDTSVVAVVDLLECPEEKAEIRSEVWKQLLHGVDPEKLLDGTRENLLTLFNDKYERAQRQTLVGLNPESEAYNTQLNDSVQEWLADHEYAARRLADHWKRRQKGLIVVIDNTDQFAPQMQDYCFTLAHHLSTELDCLVAISMREERFHHSKLHGTLDAFQNSGFHLSSPPPPMVFHRRVRYLLEILDDPEVARKIVPQITDEQAAQIQILLRIFLREFRRKSSPLNVFLRACAHGDMRLALDFFREFLLSGYTKVDEMINNPGWRLQTHQVLRPMMVPYRFFYDETKSSIPNVYQVRSPSGGSHFTACRILSLLSDNMSPENPTHVPLSAVRGYFANTFNMVDDFEKNLNVLLKVGIVESDNRVDEYTDEIDSIRITPYGFYIATDLAMMFNYIDLVCLDCAVHDEGVARSLAHLADEDINLYFKSNKMERVEVRLRRAQIFVEYLVQEEEGERDTYSLDENDVRYSKALSESLRTEKERILRSAKRNYGKKQNFGPTLGDYWD